MASNSNQFYHISGLLEKMTNIDKDFRYMAVNDLMVELSKQSITLDEDMERRIVKALLILIQDKNGEVQNLACRCLGPLVHKIKVTQLEALIDSLCLNMSSQNEQLRDVSSIALKTVLNELPSGTITAQVFTCIKRVVPKLVDTLKTDYKGDSSVKLEVLDILATLLLRYGRYVNLHFDEVESVLFQQLEKERQTLRKRAITALGHLTDVVPDDQFERIVQKIVRIFSDEEIDLTTLKTFILCSITTCRSSASRISRFLQKIVPILIEKFNQNDDDELREICLQAFETFIFRCTTEVEEFVPVIIEINSKFLSYDPNYNYGPTDDSEEMEMDASTDSDNPSDQDEDDAYSDDDDLSWKVRRAAAKTIEALITYRPEKLSENYDNFGQLLISRFREREDNVKYDIFTAYSSLLKLTRQLVPELSSFLSQGLQSNSDLCMEVFLPTKFKRILQEELNPNRREIFSKLERQIPSLMRAIQKELRGKNIRTRLNTIVLLSHLIRTYPGILADYMEMIAANICATLNDNLADGTMKIEILRFTTLILNTHDPQNLRKFVDVLVPFLSKSIGDNFYKISGEALTTTQSVLRVLFCQLESGADVKKQLPLIYTSVISKLKITDIDQEVKEKTISTTGFFISMFSSEIGAQITEECFPILLDRLRNEMTRQITLRSFNTFVSSFAKLDLQPILPDLLSLCADFLRKNQRSLRLNTLLLLESLVARFAHNGLQGQGLIKVVREIPALISEQDLQISQIAITFITHVVNSYPDQILADSLDNMFRSLIALVQSSLLQGVALNAALNLFSALIRSPLPNKPTFEQIIERLTEPIYQSTQLLHRQSYSSISKSVANITQATGDQQKSMELVIKLGESLAKQSNDSLRLFSILALGELGRTCSAVLDSLKKKIQPEFLIIDAFGSQLEEIKTAASYALGSLATGNLSKFLPFLLSEISKEEKKQYLFLHALKEVINSQCDESGCIVEAEETFKSGIEQIWEVLMKYCNSAEESIRNVVAECTGRLCTVNPEHFITELLNNTRNQSPNIRATIITALRFIVTEHPRPVVDEYLRPMLGEFLNAIRDEDFNVRRVAIVTLNSVIHNKPKLVKECLPDLLPALYNETKVKQELVREVEMGPFKHLVDDGLDLRKAAFECMYTLADQCLDRVNLNEYLTHVEEGLKDLYDIKLLTYLMLTRLVHKCPIQVSQRIDGFCDHIKPQLLLRAKPNAVKQENDKQDELKRSAVRAVLALRRAPNSDRSQKMTDLMEIISSNPDLATMKEQQTREHQIWAINGFGTGNEAMEME